MVGLLDRLRNCGFRGNTRVQRRAGMRPAGVPALAREYGRKVFGAQRLHASASPGPPRGACTSTLHWRRWSATTEI
jgi:hypothetical protein